MVEVYVDALGTVEPTFLVAGVQTEGYFLATDEETRSNYMMNGPYVKLSGKF